MAEHRPAFTVTVPTVLYDKAVELRGGPWADSWLHGGTVSGRGFMPRTRTGHEKLKFDAGFRQILRDLGLTLIEPEPFGGDTRPVETRPDAMRRQAWLLDRQCGVVGDISKLSPERRDLFERATNLRAAAKRMEQGRGA